MVVWAYIQSEVYLPPIQEWPRPSILYVRIAHIICKYNLYCMSIYTIYALLYTRALYARLYCSYISTLFFLYCSASIVLLLFAFLFIQQGLIIYDFPPRQSTKIPSKTPKQITKVIYDKQKFQKSTRLHSTSQKSKTTTQPTSNF